MAHIAKVPKSYRKLAYRIDQSRRWHKDPRSGTHTRDEDLASEFAQAPGATFEESVTPDLFKSVVSRLVRRDAPVTPADVAGILERALAIPLAEFHVVRPVHGVAFKSPVNRLGRTTVRSPNELHKAIESWPGEKTLLPGLLPGGFTAEVVVRARTGPAALKLGDRALKEFEALMRLAACGSGGHSDFNVFEVRTGAYLAYVVHGANAMITGTTLVGPDLEVEHSEEELLADRFTVPMRALWDIHSREERTRVEGKIMTSAFWFSLARRELDPVKSVPFGWYSIEALLPYSSAESTLSQIARWASHLIDISAANAELRKGDIERLYDHRSDIAHGRVSSLPESVRDEALRLCEFLLNNACDEKIRHAHDEEAFAEAILANSLVTKNSATTRNATTDVYRVRKDVPPPG